jgi:DNA-binding NtrC family response regulator
MGDHTVPISTGTTAIRAIRVEVKSGPDAGTQYESSAEALSIGSADGNDLMLGDPTVSRFHLELRREVGGIVAIDHGSTNGTRIGPVLLRAGRVGIDAGSTLEVGQSELLVADGGVVELETADGVSTTVLGKSPALRRLLASATRVARTDVSVLLTGESGTGKELVARGVHDASPRREGPCVTVDCAAIMPTLFASELFGHERGAFTGAERQHIGAFERARGGTLFLDEVGELTPELQSALLGVLERRKLRRVGGRQDMEVDVRLVSATHRDLRAEVNAGTFRLDLFYRIAVVHLAIPPLRERQEDVPMLVEHFLREAGHEGAVRDVFTDADLTRLRAHYWPGNVRELKNVVLGTLALGESPDIGVHPSAGSTAAPELFSAVEGEHYRDAKKRVVDEFERHYVSRLLSRAAGNIRQAARDARMDRSYLMELIKRHQLK